MKSWLDIENWKAENISSVFQTDQYFDFIIINSESATYHKYIEQNGRNTFMAILKTLGNSILILSIN